VRRAAGMAALVITPATDRVSSAEILMAATVVIHACPQVAQVIYLYAHISIFNLLIPGIMRVHTCMPSCMHTRLHRRRHPDLRVLAYRVLDDQVKLR
jgi:hypothetical protein